MELETVRTLPGAQRRVDDISEQRKEASLSDVLEKLDNIIFRLEKLENSTGNWNNSSDSNRQNLPEVKFTSSIHELEQHVITSPLQKATHTDEALLRQIVRKRRLRARFFDKRLFHDPAWNMLLDLAAAHGEQQKVSVSSLCQASGVPATSALRWIAMMSELDLVVRIEDPTDRRRTQIQLSAKGLDAMRNYFSAAGLEAKLTI